MRSSPLATFIPAAGQLSPASSTASSAIACEGPGYTVFDGLLPQAPPGELPNGFDGTWMPPGKLPNGFDGIGLPLASCPMVFDGIWLPPGKLPGGADGTWVPPGEVPSVIPGLPSAQPVPW